jgi:hypothetical protein
VGTHAPVWSRLAVMVGLIVVAWAAAVPLATPSPKGTEAPAAEFSAARARNELEVVAARPHPVGSEANRLVRDHLLRRAAEAGLAGEIVRGGGAENVIVTMPGSDPTGEILVTAHYDSVPAAPGAGDAGVAVVSLVEAMRALAAGPELRNDVVFLFSDGEEAGWLGSTEFSRSPEAEAVTLVVAMESEPGTGPTTLQQTTSGDGWLVRQLAAADPPAWISSVSNSAEREDFDSDFDVLSGAGLVGVEFANPKDATRYHLAGDTVDAVDLGHLQAHGETVMSLVRQFGALDLNRSWEDGDRVFTTLPGVGIVSMSVTAAVALAIAALLGLGALLLLAGRRGHVSSRTAVRGVLVMGAAIVTLVIAGTACWAALTEVFGTSTVAFPDFEGSDVAMAALLFAVGSAFVFGLIRYARARDPLELALGALVWVGVIQILLLAVSPLAVALATWPLLGGITAVTALLFAPRSVGLPLFVLAAAPAMLLLLPQLYIWISSPSEPEMAILVEMVLLACLIPQIAMVAGCTGFRAGLQVEVSSTEAGPGNPPIPSSPKLPYSEPSPEPPFVEVDGAVPEPSGSSRS